MFAAETPTSETPSNLESPFDDWETVYGPFFAKKNNDHGSRWSIPLLYSRTSDSRTEHTEWDILYPLISSDQYGEEQRLHILQLFSLSGGTQSEGSARRTTVFPFYFRQRASDPAKNSHALFPFYGTVKNRLLRDEVKVVAFPLYVQSKKKDVVTNNYLVPFFHLRRGNKLKGWQVWPLAGWETKQPTTKTNVLGKTSLVGGHRKLTVAWPFYMHDRTALGTPNPKNHRALLPLFSSFKSSLRTSFTAPWPLGISLTNDQEKQYREIGLPWPLIVFARGDGKTVNRVWPLFGQAANPHLASQFYLWPLYRGQQLETDYDHITQKRWGFMLYVDKTDTKKSDQSFRRRRDFWPFFTWRTTSEGDKQFQALAPVAPLFPANETVARHYSPAFALWRSVRSSETGRETKSFLWNLYRREASNEEVQGSALFGLIRWKRSPERKSLKVFGLRVSNRKSANKNRSL